MSRPPFLDKEGRGRGGGYFLKEQPCTATIKPTFAGRVNMQMGGGGGGGGGRRGGERGEGGGGAGGRMSILRQRPFPPFLTFQQTHLPEFPHVAAAAQYELKEYLGCSPQNPSSRFDLDSRVKEIEEEEVVVALITTSSFSSPLLPFLNQKNEAFFFSLSGLLKKMSTRRRRKCKYPFSRWEEGRLYGRPTFNPIFPHVIHVSRSLLRNGSFSPPLLLILLQRSVQSSLPSV